MIDAKELRIGNTILINGELVTPIGYSVIMDVAQKQKGIKNNYLDSQTFEAIPITEDILLKCGFEKSQFNDYTDLYRKHPLELMYNVANGFEYYSNGRFVIVKSLHQLQNLYFAISGWELNIKGINNYGK